MSTINVPEDEKTIQGAVNRANDGDTVVVHGESEAEPTLYPERVNVINDIRSLAIKAEPRRSVTMPGFHSEHDGTGLVLDGFMIDDVQYNWAVYIASPNVTIRDFAIIDAPWAAIYCDPNNPDLPGGTIEDCHAYGCGTGFHTTGVGWRILNNVIERLREHGTGRDVDAMRGWGRNLLIKGNWIHGTTFDEIGSAHVDGFQTFDKNDERQLHGLRYVENIVEDAHQGLIFEDVNTPGDVEDVEIYNNWFRNLTNTGVLVKYGVRNVRVRHNLFQGLGGGNNNGTGIFARYGAEVHATANIFLNAGSNYKKDADSILTGGFNILNRQGHPYYSSPTDLLDVDPELDTEGYQTKYLAGDGVTPIGRIRPGGGTEPEPDPEYSEVGHMHTSVPPHTHVAGGVRPSQNISE